MRNRGQSVWTSVSALVILFACSRGERTDQLDLAKRLVLDGNPRAALSEVAKLVKQTRNPALLRQAHLLAAKTAAESLNQNSVALEHYRRYLELSLPSAEEDQALLDMGEILAEKLEQPAMAAQHYERVILEQKCQSKRDLVFFRLAQAYFHSGRFELALKNYGRLLKEWPKSQLSEVTRYEIGFTLLTRASQDRTGSRETKNERYQEVIDAFDRFVRMHPTSHLAVLARFGSANALEETDQLSASLQIYKSIESQYPAPEVVAKKISRIQRRLELQRRRN